MPDGVLLCGAGLASIGVAAVLLIRDSRRGITGPPGWQVWTLLGVGWLAVASGAWLFWSAALFSG